MCKRMMAKTPQEKIEETIQVLTRALDRPLVFKTVASLSLVIQVLTMIKDVPRKENGSDIVQNIDETIEEVGQVMKVWENLIRDLDAIAGVEAEAK